MRIFRKETYFLWSFLVLLILVLLSGGCGGSGNSSKTETMNFAVSYPEDAIVIGEKAILPAATNQPNETADQIGTQIKDRVASQVYRPIKSGTKAKMKDRFPDGIEKLGLVLPENKEIFTNPSSILENQTAVGKTSIESMDIWESDVAIRNVSQTKTMELTMKTSSANTRASKYLFFYKYYNRCWCRCPKACAIRIVDSSGYNEKHFQRSYFDKCHVYHGY